MHSHIRLLALTGLLTTSGCATFFGPYQSLLPVSEVSVQPDASPQTNAASGSPQKTESASYRSEFDTTVVSPAGQPEPQGSEKLSLRTAENTAEPSAGESNPVHLNSTETLPGSAADTTTASNVFAPQPTTVQEPAPPQENPFAVMAREDRQLPASQTPAAKPVQQTSAVFRKAPSASSSATSFREAEPRLPTPQPGCPSPADCTVACSPLVQAYPDEYICDGGDRHHPVHYYGSEMQGLDTEDTVAEFKDHEGDNHVRASNRVCVYAPRFGAIETVYGPETDIGVNHAVAARDVAAINALQEDRGLEISVASDTASGLGTRRSASGVENSQPAHMSQKEDVLFLANKVDQGMEAKTSDGPGILRASDVFELNLHLQEPATSNINTNIEAKASIVQATSTYSTFRVQSVLGTEKGGRKGEIHLTKEASPLVAQPGDTITFRIHFRNTGDYNIHDVRILDNLTPRLDYIDGSGQIEVRNQSGGGLTVVPNKEGSQTLIFELDEPLKGGGSGVITFEARVR